MSDWQAKTNAQLFYAQRALDVCLNLSVADDKRLDFKEGCNTLMLCAREAWLCWLNELSSLLAPRQKLVQLSSLQGLCERHPTGSPDVELLKQNLKAPDSWVDGFIALEDCLSPGLDVDLLHNESSNVAPPIDALSLRTVEARALSHLNGLDDIRKMLIDLKQYINEVRSGQVEW